MEKLKPLHVEQGSLMNPDFLCGPGNLTYKALNLHGEFKKPRVFSRGKHGECDVAIVTEAFSTTLTTPG